MDAGKKIKNIMYVVVLANLALVAYVLLGVLSPKPDELEKSDHPTNTIGLSPMQPTNGLKNRVTGTNAATNTAVAR